MTEAEILHEINKGFDLLQKEVYNVQDFQAHILTMIKDNFLPPIVFHREHCETLIYSILQIRKDQAKAKSGHKSLADAEKKWEALELKAKTLLNRGYSIDRFIKDPPAQGALYS